MAEEHRCQTPEGHRLCLNNCGFLGNSTTMNLCSNCYGDLCLKQQQQQQNSIKSTVESISSPSLLVNPSVDLQISARNKDQTPETTEKMDPPPQTTTEQQQRPNRCTMCRKRVGLTGFKCRCGTFFCGSHRYPEIHGCRFDFKSIGREEIAKANPLVIAVKLQKI